MRAFLSRLWHGAVFGPDPEREEVDGWAAWEAFQDDFRLREEAEKARHGRVNDVREERKALVHASLALAVPTEPVANGCSRQVAS